MRVPPPSIRVSLGALGLWLGLAGCAGPSLFGQQGWPFQEPVHGPGEHWRDPAPAVTDGSKSPLLPEDGGVAPGATAAQPPAAPQGAAPAGGGVPGTSDPVSAPPPTYTAAPARPGAARPTVAQPASPQAGLPLQAGPETQAAPQGSYAAGVTPPATGQGAQSLPGASAAEPQGLLGWEGGVVESPRFGTVEPQSGPQRDLGPSPAGRMHIIELYSQVLDERDALAEEVAALTAALQRAESLIDASGSDVASLQAHAAELQEENERLRVTNRDLAARLLTAQIRRLEAEKLLLETKIQSFRGGVDERNAGILPESVGGVAYGSDR